MRDAVGGLGCVKVVPGREIEPARLCEIGLEELALANGASLNLGVMSHAQDG